MSIKALRMILPPTLLFLMSSCWSSSQPAEKDLDVALPQKTKVLPKAEDVIVWQHLFRPPPTEGERRQIRMKLAKWSQTKVPPELLKRGRNELAIGNTKAAEATFREILRIDSDHLDAHLELAQVYLRQGQLKRCFEFLEAIKELLAGNEEHRRAFIFRYKYTLALAYLKNGDHSRGHARLSELVAIDKTFTPGYAALASSYVSLGKLEVAEFIAKRGLDRAKEDAGLYNILGIVSEKRRQFAAAEKWYMRSLELTPTFSPALINRATLQIRRGDYAAAEKDLSAALSYQPDNPQALVTLGICQRRLKRPKDAEASFNRAIDQDPDNAAARYNLAVFYMEEANRPNEAIRLFREVLQSRDNSPDIKQLARSYLDEMKAGS